MRGRKRLSSPRIWPDEAGAFDLGLSKGLNPRCLSGY